MVPFFFPGLDIKTYTNFQKKPDTSAPRNHSWYATIHSNNKPLAVLKTTRCD